MLQTRKMFSDSSNTKCMANIQLIQTIHGLNTYPIQNMGVKYIQHFSVANIQYIQYTPESKYIKRCPNK